MYLYHSIILLIENQFLFLLNMKYLFFTELKLLHLFLFLVKVLFLDKGILNFISPLIYSHKTEIDI